jgi:hypothetical protein
MIRELLADPELEQFWTFDAERRYMADTDGSPMRVYEEYHHGDDMWDIQASNPAPSLMTHLTVFAYRLQWDHALIRSFCHSMQMRPSYHFLVVENSGHSISH